MTGDTPHKHRIRKFMEGDEISRLTSKNELQFGKILQEHTAYGTFTVDWKSKNGSSIVNAYKPSNEKILKLVDRIHPEGGRVVHMENGRLGEILEAHLWATIHLPDSSEIIENVPLDNLTPLSIFSGELIEAQGWIGKVSSIEWIATVKYDDGMHCNIQMTQSFKSNLSFGYENYTKSSPPITGTKVRPTKKEFESAQWHGQSYFDRREDLMNQHRDKDATIVGVEIHKVYTKWLCPICPQSDKPKPKSIIESMSEIEAINDFDIRFKQWYKQHSLCHYTIRKEDEPHKAKDMEDCFINSFLNKIDKSEQGPPAKQAKLKDDSDPHPTPVTPHSGNLVVAEVIRIRNVYRVTWESSGRDEAPEPEVEVGSLLSPIVNMNAHSEYGFEHKEHYSREFVTVKFMEYLSHEKAHFDKIFGVAQHRDLRDELIEVKWFEEGRTGESGVLFLFNSVLPSYELVSHERYKHLKQNAVVKIRKENQLLVVGMVVRVTQSGLVEVFFGAEKGTLKIAPSELQMVHFAEETYKFQECQEIHENPLSNSLNNNNVKMVESIANDLREILESNQNDIRVKKYSADDWDTFSVLMTGPEDTPYEDGLFLFHVVLPQNYPDSPPSVCWVNLPKGQSFMSFNMCSKSGKVFHPMFKNWLHRGDENAWKRSHSLLDILTMIRDDTFTTEPFFSKAALHFIPDNDKFKMPILNKKVLAKMTAMNASIVISVFDLLIDLQNLTSTIWKTEIESHISEVFPNFRQKFEAWVNSPFGIFGDLNDYPKYHLFPISSGLSQTLKRRIKLSDIEHKDCNEGDDADVGGDDDDDRVDDGDKDKGDEDGDDKATTNEDGDDGEDCEETPKGDDDDGVAEANENVDSSLDLDD